MEEATYSVTDGLDSEYLGINVNSSIRFNASFFLLY